MAHSVFGFPHAVVKKYAEDQGGYKAVLLTYYAFLSLFPLLLILTTVMQLLLRSESHLRTQIIGSVTSYFPIIGSQLQDDIHGFRSAGIPLLIGLAVLLYGTRGIADAFRYTVNNVWHVPMAERSGFWPALGRSTAMVVGGGMGFLLAAVISSYAALAGHSTLLHLLFLLATALVLFCSFMFVIKMGLNRRVTLHEIGPGAAVATIGLLLLQILGSYIVTHELKHLDSLYGTFAVVLGLFFWLYLQTQLIVYAMQVDAVRVLKLWPRSMTENDTPPGRIAH